MRILETIKNLLTTKPTTELARELATHQFTIKIKDQEILGLRKSIDELRNTIHALGNKDRERIQALEKLQRDNTILIETNETLTEKIEIQKQDIDTQVKFMQCVNEAIQQLMKGVSELPDAMPSTAPDFYPPLFSNMENPPQYKDITQDVIQEIAQNQIQPDLEFDDEDIEQFNKDFQKFYQNRKNDPELN